MWKDEEAVFNYIGRRRVGGKNVLLFELDNKIFVKEISKRGFIQAGYWKKGERVKITKNKIQNLSDKDKEI